MTKLERLNAAQVALKTQERHYADRGTDGPSEDDHDEAQGLALAASNLAATEGDGGLDAYDDPERSYADAQGKVLVRSKKNPKVRRWIRLNAVRHVAGHIGDAVGKHALLPEAAHEYVHELSRHKERTNNFNDRHESALSHTHYLQHHGEFVEKTAKKYDLKKGVVAHALAYHAHHEHLRQEHTPHPGGRTHPLHNRDLTDDQYHKNLSGRAKSALIKGMIARHGK